MSSWLQPVVDALDAADEPVPFFFRDDDAGWGDTRLAALLDALAARSLPVDLAVIPAALSAALADDLLARPAVGLHQHGLAHVNHEPAGRKCEFGPSRRAGAQRRDIADGQARLRALLGDRAEPIFTPPWNRCTRDTAACLLGLGFVALSRSASAERVGVPGLCELPIGVDWFGRRRGARLTRVEFGARLAGAIGSGEPVGVMFHHAVMDADELRGAGELLSLVAEHERARPARMMELVAAAGSVARAAVAAR